MKQSTKRGLGFGIISGIITPLGLIIGLNSSTGSKLAIIGGIVVIALADSLSDSLGMHVSEESVPTNSDATIWKTTVSTFFFKFIFAITFIIPFLFLDINSGIVVSIIWGLSLIGIFSYRLGKERGHHSPMSVVLEHLGITVLVLIVSNYVGKIVSHFF